MRIGIVSDIHGNHIGLEKSLKEFEKDNIDKLYFLGDAVNYFSRCSEVLSILRSNGFKCIKGNHEDIIQNYDNISTRVQEIYNLKNTLSNLTDNDFNFISEWKNSIELKINNLDILCVHASPLNLKKEYVYPETPIDNFEKLKYDYIFIGHTHIPFIRKVGDTNVINVGSAGLPRLDKYLNYVTFDTKARSVRIDKLDFPFDDINKLKPYHENVGRVIKRIKKGE